MWVREGWGKSVSCAVADPGLKWWWWGGGRWHKEDENAIPHFPKEERNDCWRGKEGKLFFLSSSPQFFCLFTGRPFQSNQAGDTIFFFAVRGKKGTNLDSRLRRICKLRFQSPFLHFFFWQRPPPLIASAPHPHTYLLCPGALLFAAKHRPWNSTCCCCCYLTCSSGHYF